MSQPIHKIYRKKFKPEDLFKTGPHVNVDITLPKEAIIQRGLTKNRPVVRVTALIDTGATHSGISKYVVEKLNLVSLGKATITGVHDDKETDTFYISYTFTGSGFPFSRLLVIEAEGLEKTPFHMLVGRDILSNSLLLYDGATGEFGLEIPSKTHPLSKKTEMPVIAEDTKKTHTLSNDEALKRKRKKKLSKASRKKNR